MGWASRPAPPPASCHARGFSQMARMVPALAEVAIARAPIRFGLAVLELELELELENAHEQPDKRVAKRMAMPAHRILAEEPTLLDEVRHDPAHAVLVVGGPGPLPCDQAGNLTDLVPGCPSAQVPKCQVPECPSRGAPRSHHLRATMPGSRGEMIALLC